MKSVAFAINSTSTERNRWRWSGAIWINRADDDDDDDDDDDESSSSTLLLLLFLSLVFSLLIFFFSFSCQYTIGDSSTAMHPCSYCCFCYVLLLFSLLFFFFQYTYRQQRHGDDGSVRLNPPFSSSPLPPPSPSSTRIGSRGTAMTVVF